MQLLFAVACAMIVTAATANSASPELGLSRDVVVEVFDGKNCVGKQRRVKMGDFVGGNHDNGWDSCGDAWDDSTAMRWPWWGSFRVAAGHAVRTGSKCYDSSNKANPEPQEVGMTSEAGCVSPNYTFTYVSLAPAPLPPPLPPQSPPQLPPSPPPLPPPRRRRQHRRCRLPCLHLLPPCSRRCLHLPQRQLQAPLRAHRP